MEAVLVDIVSRVVTPSATRAGTAFGSIQNENLGNMKIISLPGDIEQYYWVPGDDDEHAGGHVDGEHVVGELPPQRELHQQAAVVTCSRGLQSAVCSVRHIACSSAAVLLQLTVTSNCRLLQLAAGWRLDIISTNSRCSYEPCRWEGRIAIFSGAQPLFGYYKVINRFLTFAAII